MMLTPMVYLISAPSEYMQTYQFRVNSDLEIPITNTQQLDAMAMPELNYAKGPKYVCNWIQPLAKNETNDI